jgi:hypothetical protein
MHSKILAFLVLITFAAAFDSTAQQRRARAGGAAGGMGGPPQARFGAAMTKLFGENKAFTADAQMEVKMQEGTIAMPGKIAFLDGKTRFEMDATKMKGGNVPPQAAEQMKQMGMAEMVSISRPDKKETYLVYPGLKAYAVVPDPQSEDGKTAEEPEIKRTEIGKETVDGHQTTKYKVVMKDDQGNEQESTLWAASDLNGFPIKIETVNEGMPSTVTFNNVKLEKPDESLFNPPADFQRYNDMGTMMRETMMKRFAPPGGVPQNNK